MNAVTGADIRAGFERLDLIGKRVVVHSSLRSFGHVVGGADTVVAELVHSFETILMPAFCFESTAPPPAWDHPEQNGCDYSFYEGWTKPTTPFIVESASVDLKMGLVSRTLARLPQSHRSDHPWHSWVAYGLLAEHLVDNHPWETTNLPLERLIELDGYLVLMGVGLSSCTAVHIAEERAGHHPFIRWATDRDGMVRRVRTAGCSKGFDNLMPYCKELFSETYVGDCRILSTLLKSFIEHITTVISSYPELTRCSKTCLRCRDAILGGPIV
jgi:aminoglycoside 3-N-acetyltransferase